MRRRLAPALAGIALAALALAGCSTTNLSGDAPSDVPPAGEFEVDAAWLAGGSLITIVTYGSSTCVPMLDDVVLDGGVLVVSLNEADAEVCTADLVPQPTLVGVPEGVDPAKELEIQVTLGDAFGETDLDAYAGGPVEEYTPSAGWVDDGVVAILTWGSSSCAPVVESAVAETPTEVVVTFVTPAADQVCTMDMAPRVAIAPVEGEVSDEATLTLGPLGDVPGGTGGGSIPIS